MRELRQIRFGTSHQIAARLCVDHAVVLSILDGGWQFVRNGRRMNVTYSILPELR